MEGFLLAYSVIVGLMLIIGLITLIYSLSRVLPYRKPLYWIAIPMNVSLIVTFGGSILRRFQVDLPPNTVLFALMLSLFLVGLLLILVPYVDRLEAKRLVPADLVASIRKTAEDTLETRINGR